jgi:hypothetical protein
VVQALLAALLLACLTIGGQQWWIKHLNDKHDAYKNKVQAATLEAYQKADATTKAIANIGEQRVTVYRDRIKTIEAINAIDTSGTPDCRLPDGVRDAVNSARANANSASARRTEAGMPTAPNDGRESREPRAPRG